MNRRCAASNSVGAKLCQRCGAILPRGVGEEAFEEPIPSYRNDALDRLATELDDYLDGNVTAESVERAVLEIETRLVTLLEALPASLQALTEHPELCPAPELMERIPRLVEAGVARFNEGLDLLYQAMADEDDEAVKEIFDSLTRGNDEICHAGVLLDQLLRQLEG